MLLSVVWLVLSGREERIVRVKQNAGQECCCILNQQYRMANEGVKHFV